VDQKTFEAVDHYIDDLLVPADPVLLDVLSSTERAGMPPIQVSPSQGKLLYLLARFGRARRILELGTLAGYSTVWMARALPADGRLITLESDPAHAEVARANLDRAGLAGRVEVLVGPALRTLPQLLSRGEQPFDLVFIDADKINYAAYLQLVLPLTRPGSLIVADNVVRDGHVLDPAPGDESARGARAFNAALAAEPRVDATVLQVVGIKGYDGLAIALVRSPRGEAT
jgi:predicted O-methyltransferase YrrM